MTAEEPAATDDENQADEDTDDENRADEDTDDELPVWIPRQADDDKRDAFVEVALEARPGWTVLELIRVDEPDDPPYNLGDDPDEQDLLCWVYRLQRVDPKREERTDREEPAGEG